MRKQSVGILMLLLPGLALSPPSARADYVAHELNFTLSNDLADNVVYGMVYVEAYDGVGAPGGGLAAGQVRITASANIDPNAYPNGVFKNFGLQKLAFNTDLALNETDVSAPPGWSLSGNGNVSEFGRFTWVASGPGDTRQNPAVILISNLGLNATPDHFLLPSEDPGTSEPIFFAGHIAGYYGEPSSHHVAVPGWVAVPPPPGGGAGPDLTTVPEPSTLVLALLGVGGCAAPLLRRFRRR